MSMERLVKDVQNIEVSDPHGQQLTGNGSVSHNLMPSKQYDSHLSKSSSHITDKETAHDKTERELGLDQTNANENGNHSSDDSDEESFSDEDDIKAPIELIGEFLHYVRTSDWENAAKLCKMILIYEPENPVALQFQTLIKEKAEIEKELAEMSSSSEEESSTDDEDTSDEEEKESEDAEENQKDKDDEPDDAFEPRPGSKMKNPLVFPHHDPVWKP